jgi:ELWxxDGT repeat protein
MVKDINANLQCSNGDQGDSRPRGLANVGGTLLFRACGGPDNGTTNGFELWKSNGTEAGTTLVKDINTNAADHNGDSYPSRPIDVGGTAFFTATDGTDDDPTAGGTQHGYELWKSASPFTDATLVKDINLASNSSPGSFFDAGGTLIFSANDGTNGRELWKSTDGTGTNTTRVEDINTTPSVTDSSYPGEFADFGGTLFFSATDGVNGQELWTTGPFDAANTTLFKDLDPSGDSDPYYFTNVGGTLFFTAYDASNGRELWSSNGTPTGTTFFKDVNPGAGGSYPYYPSSVGGTLFFTAFDTTSGRELWSSDGTATGTTLVKDINPGNPLPSNYGPYNFTDINGTRFFAANDGNGYELWKTVPASPAGPAAPISNQFSVAGKKGNKKKGTVQYTFNLPGGGVLSEKQAGNLSAEAVASKGSVIKPTSVSAAGAGPVKITIKPNKAGKSILAQKGKLRVSVKFTFTPTGGSPGSQTLKVLLKLA